MLTKALRRYNTIVQFGQMVSYSTAAAKGSLRSKYLIGTEEVAALIEQAPPNLRILNATWYMPNVEKDAKKEHETARLTETTQYFDIDAIAAPGSDLPHTLPSVEVFTEHMKRLRVGKTDQIICYDAVGMFSVARAAWMMRFFGAENVRIMSGGLKKWTKEGRDTVGGAYTAGEGLPADGDYSYEVVDASKVVTEINTMHRLAYHLAHKGTQWQITDARGAARFLGEVPEPRPGLRSGHITGSKNLPFTDLVDAETGELKTDKELARIVTDAGIDTTRNTVNSCGSGVTACIVDLSLRILGAEKTAIYDGSWSEYVSVF